MKTYGDLLEYAIQQNQYGHDVFIDYQPHVDEISVRIFKNGWRNDKNGINAEKMRGYLDKTSAQDFINFIKNALEDDATEEHY